MSPASSPAPHLLAFLLAVLLLQHDITLNAGLIGRERCCILCCWFNMDHALSGRECRLVIGLGVSQPFYKYGGENYRTVSDFTRLMWRDDDVRPTIDFHSWLEDADGAVYDVIDEYMSWAAAVRGKELSGRSGAGASAISAGRELITCRHRPTRSGACWRS